MRQQEQLGGQEPPHPQLLDGLAPARDAVSTVTDDKIRSVRLEPHSVQRAARPSEYCEILARMAKAWPQSSHW